MSWSEVGKICLKLAYSRSGHLWIPKIPYLPNFWSAVIKICSRTFSRIFPGFSNNLNFIPAFSTFPIFLKILHFYSFSRFSRSYINLQVSRSPGLILSFGGSFSNRGNVRASLQFKSERQSHHLKFFFFSKTGQSIFIKIASDQSNKTNFSSIETNKPLPSLVLHSSDLSSDTTS